MLINGDSNHIPLEDNSIDLICTDPPYGISFMGKDWDKALPDREVWQQCYRVLKEGKLAFVMCSPRQDVLSRMIISLEDAGFKTGYSSIYWTYASGFPKAANVSKLIDKRNGRTESEYKQLGDYIKSQRIKLNIPSKDITQLFPSKTGGLTGCLWNWENGENVPTVQQWNMLKDKLNLDNRFDELIERTEAEREIIFSKGSGRKRQNYSFSNGMPVKEEITKPATEEAKAMEGAYVGFQPKPAIEIILIVSKGKTLTWLDDCRIPYQSDDDSNKSGWQHYDKSAGVFTIKQSGVNQGYRKTVGNLSPSYIGQSNQKGRFPANLLVSDDVLNDGKITKSKEQLMQPDPPKDERGTWQMHPRKEAMIRGHNDIGSYSRYFDLDKWYKDRFPFIITPKASKSERNEGCEDLPLKTAYSALNTHNGTSTRLDGAPTAKYNNNHPTVKPIKLMSYLITLGSREGDLILDPFVGSGTTYKACLQTHRRCIGIEINKEYVEIAKARISPLLKQTKLVP